MPASSIALAGARRSLIGNPPWLGQGGQPIAAYPRTATAFLPGCRRCFDLGMA